jgi:hypothetical protein
VTGDVRIVYNTTNIEITVPPIVDVVHAYPTVYVRCLGVFAYKYEVPPVVRLLPENIVYTFVRVSEVKDGVTTLELRQRFAPPDQHLVDKSTGAPLSWEILTAWIDRNPIRSFMGYVGLTLAKIEIKVKGFVTPDKHLARKVLRFMPHNITCIIEGMQPRIDGTTDVTLREYVKPVVVLPLGKTRNRIRYRRVGPDRFAVHDNRGPVLGHVVRTSRGYEIENRFYNPSKTMKGILVHFRAEKSTDKARRLSEQIRRDGILNGLLTVNEVRQELGLSARFGT